MRNNLMFFLVITLLSCKSNAQVDKLQEIDDSYKDPFKDLPKELNYKYGKPMIPDEETALQYADLVLKKRYNIPFDEFKPYQIKLIADDRVWEIKVSIERYVGRYVYYFIRINKNNGEIVNCWREGI